MRSDFGREKTVLHDQLDGQARWATESGRLLPGGSSGSRAREEMEEIEKGLRYFFHLAKVEFQNYVRWWSDLV